MQNKKKAFIDQILLWMVILIGFITIFFIIIDYSVIARLKSNMDLMSKYSTRMISLDKDYDDIAASLNNMKASYFAAILSSDIVCTEELPISGVNEYQVLVNITSKYNNSSILSFTDTISSKVAAFNEKNANFINCTIALRAQ